jgi:EamA domain-containing membrane protein RarD
MTVVIVLAALLVIGGFVTLLMESDAFSGCVAGGVAVIAFLVLIAGVIGGIVMIIFAIRANDVTLGIVGFLLAIFCGLLAGAWISSR